jgi:Domain of unknown function (DUF4380)
MFRYGLLGMLAMVSGLASAVVSVKRVDYKGWKDSVQMSNGMVELVYVPQIGRIMRYAFVGGPNLLWENAALAGKTQKDVPLGSWANFGGDKLWPAPQSLWNWPPDPRIDGAPVQVRVVGDHLMVVGQPSPKSGLRMLREISLEPSGTNVLMRNTMANLWDRPQELALWQITQVAAPDYVLMPTELTKDMPQGWATYETMPAPSNALSKVTAGAFMKISPVPGKGFKVGSPASLGTLSATKGNYRFTTKATKQPGGTYVDGGKFLQVYMDGGADPYSELELTGPLTKIPANGLVRFDVTWSLDDFSPAQK